MIEVLQSCGSNNRWWGALYLVIFISILALGTELVLLSTFKEALCPTDSCRIAGEYVRYGNRFLVAVGALYFSMLFVLIFFARRYARSWLWALTMVMILGGMAFDAAILGFQIHGLEEVCIFCISIACLLFVCYLLLSIASRSVHSVLVGCTVWVAAFMAGTVLLIPHKTPSLEDAVLYRISPESNEYPKLYLFVSLSCPGCMALVQELALSNITGGNLCLAAIDSTPKELMRLAVFLDRPKTLKNPFVDLAHVIGEDLPQDTRIPKPVSQRTSKARTFLTNSGVRGVPQLVACETDTRRVIVRGDSDVRNYLAEHGIINTR